GRHQADSFYRRKRGLQHPAEITFILLQADTHLRMETLIKFSPDIIDSDHNGYPVRGKIHHILLPPATQIPAGISADTCIKYTDPFLRIIHVQKGLYISGIAVSQIAVPFTHRVLSAAVRHRIPG